MQPSTLECTGKFGGKNNSKFKNEKNEKKEQKTKCLVPRSEPVGGSGEEAGRVEFRGRVSEGV
jgi:hypothetical protein